jgi:hypothetical protein
MRYILDFDGSCLPCPLRRSRPHFWELQWQLQFRYEVRLAFRFRDLQLHLVGFCRRADSAANFCEVLSNPTLRVSRCKGKIEAFNRTLCSPA